MLSQVMVLFFSTYVFSSMVHFFIMLKPLIYLNYLCKRGNQGYRDRTSDRKLGFALFEREAATILFFV